MSKNRFVSWKGKEDDDFAGRTFVKLQGHMPASRAALNEAGAIFKGSEYLLPEDKEQDLLTNLESLQAQDQVSELKDRVPVDFETVKKLRIGDIFDFGGEVGNAAITGIGTAFTPKPGDENERLQVDREVAYVYNANAPKSAIPKPKLTEEEMAAIAEKRAAKLDLADKTRVPVLTGSVTMGDTISVNGNDVTVTGLGKNWDLDQTALDRLKARFPNAKFEVGASVQFAGFDAPEMEPKTDSDPVP